MGQKDLAQHLIENTEITDRGCFEWTKGRHRKGYGQVLVDGKNKRTHRLSYETFVGPIPDGLFVLHKCDNPCCLRPSHLFLGTNMDNVQDCMKKERHVHGEQHGRAELTKAEVCAIRQAGAAGESKSSIAAKFGINRSRIYDINSRRTWKHLP